MACLRRGGWAGVMMISRSVEISIAGGLVTTVTFFLFVIFFYISCIHC